jgi:BirA family biotin operon repressor/biotin-[acetyl-CoA-carboxylase] ligase
MDERLSKKIILQSIEDGMYPGGVHLFDSIDSTNDWALEEIRRGRVMPFVCLAEHQARGRGRRGRHWQSPAGANIYLSLAWHFGLAANRLGVLPLAIGVAVKKALLEVGVKNAWVKWPNDILVDNEKIAGVLLETQSVRAHSCNMVIGIGVNYRMPLDCLADSGMCWTDVAHSTGAELPGRNRLVAILINAVDEACHQYQQDSTALLMEIKDELDKMAGRNVCVHFENDVQLKGEVLGINATGELRVLVNGEERVFNSADVSLRKPGEASSAGGLC